MFPTLVDARRARRRAASARSTSRPIKALLNNQEDRLGLYTEMVGLRRFVWHGDVDRARAARVRRTSPAELLMTTPESLEVMLALAAGARSPGCFATCGSWSSTRSTRSPGTDRGAHLMSVLERLADSRQHDVQRVGLSATVGNPEAILAVAAGTSKRDGRGRRSAEGAGAPPDRGRSSTPSLVTLATRGRASWRRARRACSSARAARSPRRSPSGCATAGPTCSSTTARSRSRSAGSPRSASTAAATPASSAPRRSSSASTSATSTSCSRPTRPAPCRRSCSAWAAPGGAPSTTANTTFFCENPEAVLQAIALVELAREGWVESIPRADALLAGARPPAARVDARSRRRSARALLGASSRGCPTSPASPAPSSTRPSTSWCEHDYLFEAGGLLSMGEAAERMYGRKNFLELYAVFSSPQYYRVMTARAAPTSARSSKASSTASSRT